jgi:lipopolysaccharide transport system permease protein
MKKYLLELWYYRKIIYQLVLLSFKTEFRQSLIGPIWHIIQPLIASGVLLVVFKEILGTAKSLENPYLTFFSAIIFWNIFLQSFTSSAFIFEANKGIFSKIYFPRVIPIISNSGITFFRFLLQLLLYFFIYYLTESNLTLDKFIVILTGSLVIFFHIILLGMGSGMMMASASTVYKDLLFSIPFITNLLFFATPIVYEINNINSSVKNYIFLNPLALPIQSAKDLLQLQFTPDSSFAFSIIFALVLFFLSGFIFTFSSRRFVDTI